MSDEKLNDNISIEDAFKKLEEITAVLESPETSLKDSLDVYAEGVKLIQSCKDYLQDVQKEMITLTGREGE